MAETITINYESLFDLLRREKSREELQKLDDSFYAEIALFLKAQERIMFEAAAGADYERIKIQIGNIKKILRELYERRERKILNLATYKVRTATNILDISSLLPEERLLFERLCQVLSTGRDAILEPVLLGKPTLLDLLTSSLHASPQLADAPGMAPERLGAREIHQGDQEGDQERNQGNSKENQGSGEGAEETQTLEPKLSLRFRVALPEFLGRDMEIYGPFNQGDTAQVSKTVAEVLVERKAADFVEER